MALHSPTPPPEEFSGIGPLHDPVTKYGINYAGTQRTQWDLQPDFPLFCVSLCYLRSSIIYSIPCDRIVPRVYCYNILSNSLIILCCVVFSTFFSVFVFNITRSHRPFLSSLVSLFKNESKCETFDMKMSPACRFILMQVRVIFIRKVSHSDSL